MRGEAPREVCCTRRTARKPRKVRRCGVEQALNVAEDLGTRLCTLCGCAQELTPLLTLSFNDQPEWPVRTACLEVRPRVSQGKQDQTCAAILGESVTQQSSHDAEIISLLMREYESLRAEVSQRVAARMQILGFAGVIAALITTGGLSPHKPNLYLAVLSVILGLLWLRDCNQGIQRIGRHLCRVEEEVNRLSTRAYGGSPLSWETNRHTSRQSERPAWRFIGWIGGWSGRH